MTPRSRRERSLEAALGTDALEPYVAYAEWMERAGNPHAELIRMELAMLSTPVHQLPAFHARRTALLAALYPERDAAFDYVEERWVGGFVHELALAAPSRDVFDPVVLLAPLFDLVPYAVLRKLTLRPLHGHSRIDRDSTDALMRIIGERIPTISRVVLAAPVHSYSAEPFGDCAPLAASFPRLSELVVERTNYTASSRLWFPELRRLSLDASPTIRELLAALDAPRLEHLAVRDYQTADDLACWLAPRLGGLRELELIGPLTTRGAEALAASLPAGARLWVSSSVVALVTPLAPHLTILS